MDKDWNCERRLAPCDHPTFFAKFGGWGGLLAAGLEILALAAKFYRLHFLKNDDR